MDVTGAGALRRLTKYTLVRAVLLAGAVVAGVFLAILATNYGGYIDDIFREGVDYGIIHLSQSLRDVPTEKRFQILEQARWDMEEEAGLHQPFLMRCLHWLGYGLTLNWGDAGQTRAGIWVLGTRGDVLSIILDRLSYTLLLAGAANLLLFLASVGIALRLSRRHGTWLDKLAIGLSPISSVPNWIHGVLLILIFAAGLRILPFGGMFGDQPPSTKLGYIPTVLKHMILPVTAIFLGSFFQSVYAWRSYFLLHADEDYVELAKARGLPARMLERHHILRPALPNVLTSFALMLISFWQGVIILEVIFDWPGLGKLFVESILGLNRPIVVGSVVTFAYLLGITVFVLDIAYAVVDPRVRVGGAGQASASAVRRHRGRLTLRLPRGRVRHSGSAANRSRGASRHDSRAEIRSRGPEPLPGVPSAATGAQTDGSQPRQVRWRLSSRLGPAVREMARYPSALVGLVIIAILVGVSIYALIAMPYGETVTRWRGGEEIWYRNPRKALPEWINFFRKAKLPPTIVMDSRDSTGAASKIVTRAAEDMAEVTLSFPFDFAYDVVPQDLVLRLEADYEEKRPHVSLDWLTPDGREIDMGSLSVASSVTYYLSQDRRLERRLNGRSSIESLFSGPAAEASAPLRGRYELQVQALLFEDGADLDAEFLLQGQVQGLAGTDHRRRDLLPALLWGMPLALSFGFVGAVVTATASMAIAAIGSWFGGWVDNIIQRLTEVYMVLPVIPICITVYLAADKSIWVVLGVVVLLNIFGSAVKNYRAIFLQVKEEPYVEAARAYGASNKRIVLRYLVPRIVPVLIPQLVILIPSYVYLEAMLAYLGVSDPSVPTWGKLVEAGISHGLYTGAYHMLLAPLSLLLLLGLAFVMLGLSLERLFQSRLRRT